MKNKSLWIVLGIVAVVLIWGVTTYNGLVSKDEKVASAWANVETVYQRRADLIPNLVNTVKGYAAHESKTLAELTEARAKSTAISIDPSTATPAEMEAWMEAQGEVGSALGRLIAISENYPELKANQNFLELQAQLEGTENRITVARKEFNDATQSYNTTVRRFPANLVAMIFGFDQKPYFSADESAATAPKVEF